MTIEEFTARTGYEPEGDQWRQIIKDYQKNDWEDKDMFCRRWLIERGLYHKIGNLNAQKKL